jgi:hypothetical protein
MNELDELLEAYATGFYGYGSKDAQFWFISQAILWRALVADDPAGVVRTWGGNGCPSSGRWIVTQPTCTWARLTMAQRSDRVTVLFAGA